MDNEIKQIINRNGITSRDKLIPVLQEVQEYFGFLPKQAIAEVAKKMEIPVAKIHGIITFYNQFSYEPKGEYHIRICRGTSCHMNQSGILLESLENKLGIRAGQTTRDHNFSLEIVPCLGACGQGPVLAVNDEYYTEVNQKALETIIDMYQKMT
ncbi:MAG: NADH-quinone oxidoreductase subunit NuoE [Bacteroidales bacterium]|nr:NADH-quinone oxidoreductase subunit NuoE [Bacteroidales bacterium]